MKTLKIVAATTLTAAIALSSMAFAEGHEDLDPAVKARQAHMQLYAHNLGILGGMAQEKIPYDSALANIAASNLAALANLDEVTYWTEGTVEGSRALPAIWENMDDFMDKQDGMAAAADTMVGLAGVDLATLQGGMRDLGGACSACHREYRQRDE
ncbi:MAG: cytochrome c [Octadecabacter sp.]|nr:cytochrome c [Octadecabacter sp.]